VVDLVANSIYVFDMVSKIPVYLFREKW
jgi:hypothetical protein